MNNNPAPLRHVSGAALRKIGDFARTAFWLVGRKMIVVQLMGGLGNQLFQFAAGRALAHRLSMPLLLDIRWYHRHPERPYVLHNFKIVAEIAPAAISKQFTLEGMPRIVRRLWRRIEELRPPYRRRIFAVQPHRYDLDFEKIAQPTYLVGYFQSEKFFGDISKLIQRELTLNTELSEPCRQVAELMNSSPASVSVHIRRGDYLRPNNIFVICSMAYYQAAIAHIMQSVPSPHLFVFSDDPAWCKANFQTPCEITYVSDTISNSTKCKAGSDQAASSAANQAAGTTKDYPDKDYEEMWLISQCKHHIIANSTFSWWGAWLSSNPDKIVVAPKRWYLSPDDRNDDLIPARWILIDA